MPGVPGAGGPVPKRSNQRRRNNKPEVPIQSAPGADVVVAPPADAGWHPIAKGWYQSLAASGQQAFYEPSDWMTAVMVAESMSRDLKPQVVGVDAEGAPVFARVPLKGASLAAYLKAFTALLVTEGDRRRSRLELQRGRGGEEAPADVSELDQYRSRLNRSS